MKNKRLILLTAALAFGLGACSNPPARQNAADSEPRENKTTPAAAEKEHSESLLTFETETKNEEEEGTALSEHAGGEEPSADAGTEERSETSTEESSETSTEESSETSAEESSETSTEESSETSAEESSETSAEESSESSSEESFETASEETSAISSDKDGESTEEKDVLTETETSADPSERIGETSEPEPLSSETENMSENESETEQSSTGESEAFEGKDGLFEAFTAAENEYCAIRIQGIDDDELWGYTIKLEVENKTSDRRLMFGLRGAAVNHIATDALFACEVPAGEKASEAIIFTDEALDKNVIGEFSMINLNLVAYDADKWLDDNLLEKKITLYPLGKEKASVYERQAGPDDQIIFENEDLCMTATAYAEDPFWGFSVLLYLENKTDKDLLFSLHEVRVNGCAADPYFAVTVPAGMNKFTSLHWSKELFDKNGIEDVELIEGLFKVYDDSDWLSDTIAEGTFKLEVEGSDIR